MNIKISAIILTSIFGLSACSDDVKTSEWYAENPEAAQEKLAECSKAMTGIDATDVKAVQKAAEEMQKDEGCMNATQGMLKSNGLDIEGLKNIAK